MKNKKLFWVGWIISLLTVLQFAFSALAKIFPATFYPQIIEQMTAIGLPASILTPIAILEVLCIVIYLIPATAVLGAILFTGYVGGTILTHLRVGQPVYVQITLGILIWVGLYLREPRLHELLPIRKKMK